MDFMPWFLLLMLSYVQANLVRVDPLVLISNQGLVRGHKAADGDYSIFLGIPYAQVDVNNPFSVSIIVIEHFCSYKGLGEDNKHCETLIAIIFSDN